MQVVIFGKSFKEQDTPYIQTLIDKLEEMDIGYRVYHSVYRQIKNKITFAKTPDLVNGYKALKQSKTDFFITLGGDGTILESITVIRDLPIPILGINLGRLGFLASIEKKRIRESIVCLSQNMFKVEDRVMLHLESSAPLFGDLPFALNDCTLHKRDTSSMITIHTYINGDFLNSYWADGIIISTPTGSTGYSLSCGGPIVSPTSGNFVITPVAPHNLNVRPIVLSDDVVISFEIEGRAENYLCTLDSRSEIINQNHQVAIRKADFTSKLVRLDSTSFLQTIRSKLAWGIDSRN